MKKRLLTNALCATMLSVAVTSCTKTTDAVTAVVPVVTPVTPVTPPVAPTLTSISPAKGLPNSAVTIVGTNFPTSLTQLLVTVGGVNATVYSATATQLVVGVPATAKTGNIVVVAYGTTTLTSSTFTVAQAGAQTTLTSTYMEHLGIDANGNVYGEGNTGLLLKATPAGVVSTVFNYKTAGYTSVWGTAADAAGNVYLADRTTHNIIKVTTAGVASVFAGNGTATFADGTGTAAGFVAGPFGLAIDASGNLYTNDGARVRKITSGGVVTTLAGTGVVGYVDGAPGTALLGGSEGIAVDAAGNVYVDDNKSVRKITPTGTVTTIAGGNAANFQDGQGKAAGFNAPQAMAVDAAGNVFVADNLVGTTALPTTVYAIRMVNTAGYVSTFMRNTYTTLAAIPLTITNGTVGTLATNGVAGVATTLFPDGLAFDAAGNLYICNTGASTVSKIPFQ